MVRMARKIAEITFGLCLLAGAAAADYDPSQYPAYETCALCHGLYGVSHTAKFPNLAGQKQAYIEAQVNGFLSGHRSNDGGQMVAIVSELQPADIPFVASWFAGQAPPAPYPAHNTEDGAQLYDQLGCLGCHGSSTSPAPHLTAQHPGYLAKQMQDFRESRRHAAGLPGLHRDALQTLPDESLAAIARYLGAQERP